MSDDRENGTMITEQDLRDALEPFRPDADRFESEVRERIETFAPGGNELWGGSAGASLSPFVPSCLRAFVPSLARASGSDTSGNRM